MKKQPITEYKSGGYILRFLKDDLIYWSWKLTYKGDLLVDSSDDLYTSLAHAKRGFRASQKAMAKFTV